MSNEGKLKHLEFIQAVISRLSNCSFILKGWAVTASTVGIGFVAENGETEMLSAVCIAIAVLWILDGYYLSNERLFRRHYQTIASQSETDFNMDVTYLRGNIGKQFRCLCGSILNVPNTIYYAAVFAITLVFRSYLG